MDRSWVSAPGDGLTFSVRLEVPSTVQNWGWIPLLAGLATADAARASGAHGIGLKWPNDVVVDQGGRVGKLAGILSQREGDAVIIGIGINLAFAGARPDPNAVSVAEQGGNPDGEAMLARLLQNLHTRWEAYVAAAGDAQRSGLADDYLAQCVCVAVDVQVSAPGRTWSGRAEGIDDQGRLLVTDGTDVVAVSAGDVTLRR
jgi:BirA family biotin operon repressor/biotin-[acetyl-CoA-carboxylase] ligase